MTLVQMIVFNVVRVLIGIDLIAMLFNNAGHTGNIALPVKSRVFSLVVVVICVVLIIALCLIRGEFLW